MSVRIKLYQNKNEKSVSNNKWYGRVVNLGTVTTDRLAEEIEANCSMKKSDVLAVITELVVVMKRHLQESKRVKLDRFGSFKVGVSSKGASTQREYNVGEHIKGCHILFSPASTIDAIGHRSNVLLDGVKVSMLPTPSNSGSGQAA